LPAHLYVHVPFCRLKCSYCDFFSVPVEDAEGVEAVLAGIEEEILEWGRARLSGILDTVYVGGGTPTIIGPGVIRILESVRTSLPARTDGEVTVEANPDSATARLVEALAAAGVTRVSLGVQSFDDEIIGLLGRLHTVEEAHVAARAVCDAGLDLAIDLMCGVPGQSLRSWHCTLEEGIETGAKHVSVYPLALEDGTPLAVAVGAGLVSSPDSDAAADMMLLAEDVLGAAGFERYEVANYAVPGHESRHNTAYWTGESYIGVGPAAHGMLDPETAGASGVRTGVGTDVARVRYSNASDIEEWLQGAGRDVETLSKAEVAREDVMLGLRLARGVGARIVAAAGLEEQLRQLEAEGLVELAGGGVKQRWRTTTRGWLLGNEVFRRVWLPDQ